MKIRDRIKEIRTVRGRDLAPNPKNWRTHPKAQADAMKGLLAEVGQVDVLRAFETPDGRLMLVDGHLRAEITPDSEWKVAVLDLSPAEADKVLATFDAVGDVAGVDPAKLDALLNEIEVESAAVLEMLEGLAKENGSGGEEEAEEEPNTSPQMDGLEYRVVVDCRDEQHQAELIQRLEGEGLKCRPLMS